MKIKVIVHEAEEGGFWAEAPAIPGCAAQGDTFEELLANLYEAVEGCLSVDVAIPRDANDKARVLEMPYEQRLGERPRPGFEKAWLGTQAHSRQPSYLRQGWQYRATFRPRPCQSSPKARSATSSPQASESDGE